jgi:hypothetical protein
MLFFYFFFWIGVLFASSGLMNKAFTASQKITKFCLKIKLQWAISELQNNLVSETGHALYGYDGKCKMFMVIVINCQ